MYGAIKIGGFAFSIAACLLIAMYIRDELSFDRNYPDSGNIYRAYWDYNDHGTLIKFTSMSPPMAKVLKADFPEVEVSGRFMSNTLFPKVGTNYMRRSDQQENTFEEGFTYADPEMLQILKLPMVYGKRDMALSEPRTMVISRRKADKYFPNQDPVGRIIFLNDNKDEPYKIGGVMENIPANSHIQYDFLITLAGVELWPGEQPSWQSNNYDDYVLLKKGVDSKNLESRMSTDIIKNYMIPSMQKAGNKDAESISKNAVLHLQPVEDIHLKSYDIHDSYAHGDIRFVWLFGSIAGFILLIACVNFINLATAKSANRAKEVGLRKVVGSDRAGLISQFLVESVMYSLLSFAVALMLAWLFLPYFNRVTAKTLAIPWNEWWFFPMMIASVFVIGILSGLYPSFYLSAFKPIDVLKGQASRGSKNSLLRSGLVIFQFTASVILIISTIIIYRQTHYILNKEVGFDKDQVILIEGTNTLGKEVANFKTELQKLPRVNSVSISDYLPVDGTKRNGNTFYNDGKTREESGIDGQFWIIDDSYVQTMGMKIIAGRNLSPHIASDSQALLINQTMANQLNLKDPVGKKITNTGAVFTIAGVVADFNFESFRDKVRPVCMQLGHSSSIVSVRAQSADLKNLIPALNVVWKKFAPSQPIRYTFLDESFARMYADVQRTSGIFTGFAILAIAIACLGLFALSAFMAEQRNKEIGVRKVLGATVANITSMLSRDFVKLVFIAILIASPIAWWAMTKWLQDFEYRTTIDWWIFAIAACIAIMIAVVTVSFQSVKAALTNPVKSLKSE